MAIAALKFWHDRFIWTSPRHLGGDTSRPAVAVLIGGWGELSIGHAGREWRGHAIAVGPQVVRSIRAEQGFYSLNLDPVHGASRALREQYFAQAAVWNLSERLDHDLQQRIAAAIREPCNGEKARTLSEDVLHALFPQLASEQPVDPRVARVAVWLRRQLPPRANLKQLAELSGLSAGRLSHLFTRELGVSIKSYLLAMKMRKAAAYFGADQQLTEIAHAMGFSDSAHLSKAFQAYFAVPPSLLANRAWVDLQVYED